MNNSKLIIDDLNISLEQEVDITTRLRERESELINLIDVITRISGSSDWIKFKSLLLNGILEDIQKKLRIESERDALDTSKIHQLQGELRWAKKYSDLNILGDSFKKELVNIRKQLKINQ